MFKKCIAVSVVFHMAIGLVFGGFFGHRIVTKKEETFFQIENIGPGSVQAAPQMTKSKSLQRVEDNGHKNIRPPLPSKNNVKSQSVNEYRRPEPKPLPTPPAKVDQDITTLQPVDSKQKPTETQAVETIAKNAALDREPEIEGVTTYNNGKLPKISGAESDGSGEGKKSPGKNSDINLNSVSNAGSGNGTSSGNGSGAKTIPENPNANPVKESKPKEMPSPVPVRPYPVPVYTTNPVYPPLAKKKNWEGIVRLKAIVLPDGTVGEVTILQSSGHSVLDQAAIGALKTSLFSPALKEGVPVAAPFQRNFTFRLTSGG